MAFRRLADAAEGDSVAVSELFDEPRDSDFWLPRWQERLSLEASDEREWGVQAMRRVNPVYIPRNHLVEAALEQAVRGEEFSLFESLLEVLSSPFQERPGLGDYAQPWPLDGAQYRTFCGT